LSVVAGAFDDAEDFAEHDVVAAVGRQPEAFTQQPLWLDSGEEDPFAPGDDALIAALKGAGANLTARREPGGHDSEYWTRGGTTTCASTRDRWPAAIPA